MSGRVEAVIGSGEKGLADGHFDRAAFNDPQGMALDGGILYVADTKNHAIRRAVDLESRAVSTIAGHRREGDDVSRRRKRAGCTAKLAVGPGAGGRRPLHRHGRVPPAMASGPVHVGDTRPHAGSGREAIGDGPLALAQLAQPSGIAALNGRLFFTDSETSAVRSASVSHDGDVSTVVGQHLFTFGDVDGFGDVVRLQHPLGIDAHDGALLIADTYNNKIKRIEPATRRAESILGSGEAGQEDGGGPGGDIPRARRPERRQRPSLRRRHQQPRHTGGGHREPRGRNPGAYRCLTDARSPPGAGVPPARGADVPNRLIDETSPYLLQHAHNPVDWYPWGEEALERAEARGHAHPAERRLLGLPLVPRDGAGVVRGRRDSGPDERQLRLHKGRPRGAAGHRLHLHDGRADPHGPGRMADDRVHDSRRQAVLRRDLLPARRPRWAARLPAAR